MGYANGGVAGWSGTFHQTDPNYYTAALTNSANDQKMGVVCARRKSSNSAACLWGDGSKTFIEQHPLRPERSILYVTLEGPEAAMFVRGTSSLKKGEAVIDLPEHFALLASERGMTATLTPNSAASQGLASVELMPTRLKVKELRSGTGSYEFNYTVFAVRKRFEGFEVERDTSELFSEPATP